MRWVVSSCACAIALWLAAGCGDGVTEVIVHFDAEPALAESAARMRILVRAEGEAGCDPYDETRSVDDEVTFPTTVPVRPCGGDASRRFTVEGILEDAGGARVGSVSARSGFVEGERTHLFLMFEGTDDLDAGPPPDAGADAGPPCDCPCDGDTCVDGACVPEVPVARVHAGQAHACAIDESGGLWCWGANAAGQLGVGEGDFTPRTSPSPVTTAGPVLEVEASDDFTCHVQADHTLWCWGEDEHRQLGLGPCCTPETTDQQAPARVGTDLWDQVSLGDRHGCALSFTYPGEIWCWGRNDDGQLGEVTTRDQIADPNRMGSATDWQRVDAGAFHTCGIKTDGRLYCWGRGDDGRLGVGDDAGSFTPRRISGGDGSVWSQVSAGIAHTCAVAVDGRLWCWGEGGGGRLGLGHAEDRWGAQQVDVEGPADWSFVSAGDLHTCGIRSGEAWCWGNDLSGELGAPSVVDSSDVPVPVEGGPEGWAHLATGQSFSCGVGEDGTLWCWGSATGGRLGLGDAAEDTSIPARVCVAAP